MFQNWGGAEAEIFVKQCLESRSGYGEAVSVKTIT